ncbi:DUF3604 domain-containing protein [Haloplanus aerogenes]|uniref:DUF3604 domain-containing protein n=1 Tax=Haloplanus aerogenes TaxID=660522 RepID=A0A3M0DQN2_9EURY|nr:DUF3604 domain-containing protein [Haloplanus aerogenes]AZH24508.1 DUF3604 domain-containing protein [Haloplanus aerogenes]RMB23844.1 uncharacterized protein DUF3604 [Haloplanus aerogenes]
MNRTAIGPLIKAVETLKVFATSAPSPRALLANRRQRFDRLHAILPSTATPGDSLTLTVQAWDQCERLHRDFDATVTLSSTDAEATYPRTLTFESGNGGVVRTDGIRFDTPGIHYLTLTEDRTGERFVSNPVRVAHDHDRRVYWGDIHLHSIRSDGAGDAEAGYRFGRDVMDLDVAAYTDHDTMGFFIPPSWQRRRMHRTYFDDLCALADDFDDPGEFVTLPAYEWTKQPNMGGHLNVYFEDSGDAALIDSLADDADTYERVWARLREWDRDHDSRVVTVPHHPAEAMYPFDFASVDYDDDLAPVVEVYSQWGSSERPGSEGNPFPLAMGQGEIDEDGHYVQDAHRMGYRVGMIGSADFHGPYPGHSIIHTRPHLPALREWRDAGLGWGNIWRVWNEQSYPGGLTAFLASELTRESIMSALRARSVYATTQPDRILVDFRVNGVDVADQDDAVVDTGASTRTVRVEVAGTAPVETVEIVKNNSVWRTLDGTDNPDAGLDAYTVTGEWVDDDPITGMRWDETRGTDGDVYVARVTQASNDPYPGVAWVGPIWVEER